MSEQLNLKNVIIIQGITKQGKTFRPSDWSERLSGILSTFNDHRLSYNQHVRPLLINQVRCVIVDKELEQLNPAMFRFLTDFAADNDLKVCDGTDAHTVSAKQPKTETKSDAPVEKYRIVEILAQDTACAFTAMSALRPNLTSVAEFVEQVNGILRPTGYRLIGIFEEGREQALAVCGFRITNSLQYGKFLRIDDLSTLPEHRGQGLAKQLLNFIHEEALQQGRLQVHVNAAVGIERKESHRLYFNLGYHISSYHFVKGK
ncbi:MAG: GNAT family N-acetyltransferase [Neisseriaceae bacterium]|nr:GNAT family N-acetyltransferase [Neisseriaceae bacterium]